MRRYRQCAVSILLAALCLPVMAQPGQISGFTFMRVEPSARAAALGGSLSAMCCDDPSAFFHNPALLDASVSGMLSASYLKHLHDLSAGTATYSHHFGQYGTAAIGIRLLRYGDFERTDPTGVQDGTFDASDMVLTLGLSRHYRGAIRYGASMHFAHSGIAEYRAAALLFDAGIVYHAPVRRLTASVSVNNTGMVLNSLGNIADEVPLDVRVGVSKALRYVPLTATLTAYNLHDLGRGSADGSTNFSKAMSHTILGIEFHVISAFTLRAGYNHRRHQNLSSGSRLDIAGVAMGFGLRNRGFALDYAYTSWSFAGLHQITFAARL